MGTVRWRGYLQIRVYPANVYEGKNGSLEICRTLKTRRSGETAGARESRDFANFFISVDSFSHKNLSPLRNFSILPALLRRNSTFMEFRWASRISTWSIEPSAPGVPSNGMGSTLAISIFRAADLPRTTGELSTRGTFVDTRVCTLQNRQKHRAGQAGPELNEKPQIRPINLAVSLHNVSA